ncbi:MAG: HDIG domain-containing protein [Nitrospiraceae bacterium]|nr:HDIG domain-containing protein [Nitrospiraceae bacterium]
MNSRNDKTSVKLLPKTQTQDADREELPAGGFPVSSFLNAGIALVTAALLAFILLPRIPLLEKGDLATRSITAPYTLIVESPDSDLTATSFTVNKGELIVESGHRVTDRAARILGEIGRREGISNRLHAYAGLAGLVLIIFYLFYRDIRRYRPALIQDTKKILLLAFLLLLTIAVSEAAKQVFSLLADKLRLDFMTIGFALPVAAGAMLVSLLLDFHLALGFSFVVSVLLGISFQGDPFIPIYYFLGSIVAALSVIQCKKRTAVLKAGAFTMLVNLLVIFGIDLYQGGLVTRLWYDLSAGFVGAVGVTMIVSVTLPFFETVFDIATDIKLLELLDPNHPLLKELVYKSPGTYHHSIVIGNLAEAAAETIGENPILARVGAYYHDVGKIHKPEYFIENQRRTENKHDRLMPSMSSLIIASHVKEGVEVARQHKLPSAVIDIIHQHHGTSLITYFYQKAKELQPFVVTAEEDYRYPGPRPRTKVAAIVMLADSVEAASRTLDDPSPQRIQALTNSVITRIFLDDQLSMCDLTLKDLRDISRSFNLILSGIFHHRIDYPGTGFPGEKKRSEYQDKKHPEEKKAGDGKNKNEAHDPVAKSRAS